MAGRSATYELSPAEVLLGEIMSYCVQTGMGEGMLGELALRHRGFVPLLRLRGTLREDTAERLRAFMRRWPYGATAQQVQDAERADAKAEAARVLAASKAAAPGIADQVKAEAMAAVDRRRHARVIGGMRAISVRRNERAELIGALVDDPADVVAIVRRRWPALWTELRAQAEVAGISPVQRLFDAIEAGLAG